MAQEIERKFLLVNAQWRAQVSHSEAMRQGYMTSSPECSIRVRIAGAQAFLNFKSATLGISRHEFEYSIPVSDAEEMLALFCENRCVGKVRHYVPLDGNVWEIDVFEGANAGLIVAEIELAASDQDFTKPAWLGSEVSHDPRYYNSRLTDYPFARWGTVTPD
ncbi:MAG: CYTH domain-containing protein [Gammaproteobacteria bacterium]|nr:CYTH domain-containing protein [Gammaproteobacteria bacterium]